MLTNRQWPPIFASLLFVASVAYAQARAVTPVQTAPFMGTWVFEMTNLGPGAQQAVRVWAKDGTVAATVKTGPFSPEVVISLKRDGEAMKLAQMMEPSQTIKRGIGKKQIE